MVDLRHEDFTQTITMSPPFHGMKLYLHNCCVWLDAYFAGAYLEYMVAAESLSQGDGVYGDWSAAVWRVSHVACRTGSMMLQVNAQGEVQTPTRGSNVPKGGKCPHLHCNDCKCGHVPDPNRPSLFMEVSAANATGAASRCTCHTLNPFCDLTPSH